MAGSLSIGSHQEGRNAVTVTGSGLSNATDYNLVITEADGSSTTRKVTTDGSGGFTFRWVPQGPGKVSYRVDSLAATTVASVTGSEVRH